MKTKIRTVLVTFGIAIALASVFVIAGNGWAQQSKGLPRAVRESLRDAFPEGRIRNVRSRPKVIRIYEVDLVEDGRPVQAEVVVNGEILTVYRQVSATDVPNAVASSIRNAMDGEELERVVQKETHATFSISSFGRPRVQYRAMVEKNDRQMRLTFDSVGKLVNREVSDDEDEEGEREVSLDQVPEAVREAILRHAGEHRVREVELQTRGGRRYYEAEWMENGREVEIAVAPDGTVLGRGEEGEDDDD